MVFGKEKPPRGVDEIGKPIPPDQTDPRNKQWQEQTKTAQFMNHTDGGKHGDNQVPGAGTATMPGPSDNSNRAKDPYSIGASAPQVKGVMSSPLMMGGAALGAAGLGYMAVRALRSMPK